MPKNRQFSGIGSELRADDVRVSSSPRQIKNNWRKEKKTLTQIQQSLIGATAPENLHGEIKKFKPSHLVIVMPADLAQSR